MKKTIVFFAIIALTLGVFTGCSFNQQSPVLDIPSVSFKEGTVETSIGEENGPFGKASTTPVTVKAFSMAQTETTYERWYEVYTWATASARGDKRYIFKTPGCEGSKGTIGAVPTIDAKTEPVTAISWRDAVVWCNAASEKDGRTPVYYQEGTTNFTSDKVLRISEGSSVVPGSGETEKAVINENANGYRLPTEAEWEFAARGGNPDSPEWGYKYAGTDTDLGAYGIYKENSKDKTAEVGTRNANSAGLYDMSGNVWEWCWDVYATETQARVLRGGSWSDLDTGSAVAYRSYERPSLYNYARGFRVVYSNSK